MKVHTSSAMTLLYKYVDLGDIKLQDLTKTDLEINYNRVFRCKNEATNYKQKNYSHSTVNALSVQMKKCLQYVVDNGVLYKLRPPKKISAHTSTDQEKIINYCKFGGVSHRIYYFLISTGMRFGEAAAF